MERYFVLDKFNTWYDWHLLLTAKDVTPPEPKTNYVELDGSHGSLDLTEALTGEVTYQDRTVTASFMTDWGTHEERVALFRAISIALHGKKVKIIEPDDPNHYFYGRIKIKDQKLNANYAELTLEATCEPWRYSVNETERRATGAGSFVDVVIHNHGAKTVVPTLTVTGTVGIASGGIGTTLTSGVYKFSAIRLVPGANIVRVSGSGSVIFSWTEADL